MKSATNATRTPNKAASQAAIDGWATQRAAVAIQSRQAAPISPVPSRIRRTATASSTDHPSQADTRWASLTVPSVWFRGRW